MVNNYIFFARLQQSVFKLNFDQDGNQISRLQYATNAY